MKLPRRNFLHLAAGAAALPAVSRFAWAQTYPARPLRWIVGFPPGGGADTVARIAGRWLSDRLGQPVIIETKPGGGTNIPVQAVVNSPPDGYTLLVIASSVAINATLYPSLPFNFLRDIAPVAGLVWYPLVLEAHPSVPATTVPELIALRSLSASHCPLAPRRHSSPSRKPSSHHPQPQFYPRLCLRRRPCGHS